MIYSLSEVAKKTNIEDRTLKYYAKEGLLPCVDKTGSGAFKFTEEDFSWLELINSLRNTGASLVELKELALLYANDKNGSLFTKSLLKHKAEAERRLAEFEENINTINKFILNDEKEVDNIETVDKTNSSSREELVRNLSNAFVRKWLWQINY